MSRKPGFKLSQETKDKVGARQKELWQNPEWAAWRKKLMKETSRNCSAEERRKISESLKSRWDDPEWRAMMQKKQSEGAKARWADPEKRKQFLEQRAKARAKKDQDK